MLRQVDGTVEFLNHAPHGLDIALPVGIILHPLLQTLPVRIHSHGRSVLFAGNGGEA